MNMERQKRRNEMAKRKSKAAKAKKVAAPRIGTVVIATALLENAESRKFLCETLFTRFCPFFASVSPKGTLRAFTGFCDDFEPVAEGNPAPQYAMKVCQDEKGVRKTTFQKVGKEAIPEPDPKGSAIQKASRPAGGGK